ncbi:unnamed protein product (macronuclear) [Paramecium tetraurelia]|uniref:Uncharacterized protein n=1 Tax=Paramecium tetraurelia TaxID=5888 RepID=A0CW18_PARTE|nr:uncharacterized protein GSPATT00001187001 [Paramecium tetraurelia]CAK74985.1 unnamed protein product [Paramecium tetraurelia]|eukprot:XP_001442382.1 hypothetical protein (macronuclear) [Paramecium tetraurelia strain d4-2]
MSDEFLTCAKIIEFFWLLLAFVFFFFAAYAKFRLKKDIHLDIENLNSNHTAVKYQVPSQQGEAQEIHMVDQNEQNSGQLQSTTQQSREPPTKLEEFYKKSLSVTSKIFPQLAIAIICILNGASHAFAVACVILYFVSIILFNILQIQDCLGSQGMKNMFKLSNNIWLVCLFINYLASSLF